MGQVTIPTELATVPAAQAQSLELRLRTIASRLETLGLNRQEPSFEDAKTALQTHGIPYPVAPRTLTTLARACLGLVDEGVFDPSWQALLTLIPAVGGDDLGAVLVSLRVGTPRIP